MDAKPVKLLNFLRTATQFEVPIYQRTYSWQRSKCEQIWKDLMNSGLDDSVDAHFMGAVVYVESGLFQVGGDKPLLVIDGQQRLATVTLLLEALARVLGNEEPVQGFSESKIRNRYLLDPDESGDKRFKLLLTDTDRASLLALVQRWELPDQPSVLLQKSFDYFKEKIDGLHGDVAALCKGLDKLVIVDISLDRTKDNPQLIFESMNSTGRGLSQADLIRDFVLMGLEVDDQTELYQRYWRRMENDFGQEGYASYFDRFMRHYLTFRTGGIPREREVYETFKDYAPKFGAGRDGAEALLSDVRRFATYFCAMALATETDAELSAAFRDLRELRVDVAYPFLLQLYWDYDQGGLSHDDFVAAVRLVEAYVFRRAVCAMPTNSLNKTFSTVGAGLDKTCYLDSLAGDLMGFKSYRRFPRDEEFMRDVKVRDLYNFPRRSYWLRRIENYGHKEYTPVDEYTIEHIMPQNKNVSAEWRQELGTDWVRVHQDWLHTLGNLTLTGYNSEYSDRSFLKKRDMKGGFRESPITLNQDLRSVERWDEEAILARADRLAKLAAEVWGTPAGWVEQEAEIASVGGSGGQYSIEDFPYLEVGRLGQVLFDSLRVEVLGLDPCVEEEFTKRWVAYKAETNFVDVVPLASGLNLFLNVDIHELVDPKGLAQDVLDVGHWGKGDVRVSFTDATELLPVMALVRQAFEVQMGEGVNLERPVNETAWLGGGD